MSKPTGTVAVAFAGDANHELVCRHLAAAGHLVVSLRGEGLASLDPGPPDPATAATSPNARALDLVLIDAASARRYGPGLLRRLRAEDPHYLPVLLALPRGEDPGSWLGTGLFDDCLRLPVSKTQMLMRVGAFLHLRRQAQALAERYEAVHRSLVESSEDHIFMLDEDGRFVSSNNKVTDLGFARGGDLTGRSIEEIYPPEAARYCRASFKAVIVSGASVSFEYSLAASRGIVHYLSTFYPVTVPDGKRLVGGMSRDITSRVNAERERLLLESAMEYADDSFTITDQEDRIIYVNAGFERMTGYSAEEVAGRTLEFLHGGQDGGSSYRSILETAMSGRTWRGETVSRTKEGFLREFYSAVAPVRDKRGEVTHLVWVQRDVTEEKKARRALHRTQRLEAVGTLAGGIAHDFNNILTPIIGYTDLSRLLVPEGSELRENLDQVLLAGYRARDLVKRLLSFGRQSGEERSPMDIAYVAKEALRLIRAVLPADIRMEQEIDTGGECILADPTEIHQVIMNLCTNAQHAMRERGGILRLRLRPADVSEKIPTADPPLRPGRYQVLTVEDTGCGIPLDIADRIFDPYFTTKREGRGTGLGLATVHGIAAECGGAVSVRSEPGHGSAFDLYFPVVKRGKRRDGAKAGAGRGSDAEAAAKDELEPAVTGDILLVDDEPAIAELERRVLEREGYKVTSLNDPGAVLEMLKSHPGRFDLVITDMTMPGMTGAELASRVLELREDMPILLCTGFSERMDAEKARAAGISRLLAKPVDASVLTRAVREVLRSQRAPAG